MAGRQTDVSTAEVVRQALRGQRVSPGGLLFEGTALLTLLMALGILVVLLSDIISGAWSVFSDRGLDFVTSPISLNPETAGVSTAILGSVAITVIVTLISFPVGIGAAVYLEEYAPDNRLTRLINTNIRNLAGVPSIVYGLLGLAIFVRLVGSIGFLSGPDTVGGKNVIAAGLTLAVLVLPIVVITAAEALRAVPAGIREAGFGVGATQWEVIRSHVLPAALPGILTGTVLTLARAFGETAPLLLIGVATGFFSTGNAGLWDSITGKYTALPVVVFSWSRQPGEGFQDALAPAAILVLLVVLLTSNATAIFLRNRYERRW